MKLPQWEKAEIPENKITEYLLNTGHERGKHKAALFMECGFTLERWQELADALTRHVAENEVSSQKEIEVGTTYALTGPLRCPNGRVAYVKVVWFVQTGTDTPRLVTAYPDKKPKEAYEVREQAETQGTITQMSAEAQEESDDSRA